MKHKAKKYGIFSNAAFILKEQWNYKKSYLFAVMLLIPCEIVLSLVTAYLPAAVTGCVERHDDAKKMILYVSSISIAVVVLTFLQKALDVYKYKIQNYTKNIHYRLLLTNKILDMDYNNFIYEETKTMRERANIAITRWLNGVGAFIELNRQFITNLLGFGAFATVVAKCNPWFLLILSVSYILTAVSWLLYQSYKDSKKNETSRINLKLNYLTYRTKDLAAAKDIRVFGMTDFIIRKMNLLISDLRKVDSKLNSFRLGVLSLEEIVKCAVNFGAYVYLIKLKLDPAVNMSVKDFIWNFTAITSFSTWLSKLVDSVFEVVECNHHVDDFRNFLDIPDTMNTNKGVELPQNGVPCSIELDNVSFSYPNSDKPILNKISLFIEPGEKIAIVGLNGAGKTTLIKLITGLLKPTSGHIRINGIESDKFNRNDYYKLFSCAFQDISLLPLSIAENIALCTQNRIDNIRLTQCIEKSDISDKIKKLRQGEKTLLVKEVNEDAFDLSGGEKQKLLLARALYKDAPVIILDEPTASLDPIAESNLYMKYNELTEEKTSIYISHRLSSTKFCDRIILLDNACIAETGTHEQLLEYGGKYAEMYLNQSKYYKNEIGCAFNG